MKQDTLKSLTKALDMLHLFLNSKSEMALSEICAATGLSKATASRITTTLVKNGYLTQSEKRGKYSLGTIYIGFSGLIKSRIQLRKIAAPYLLKLSQRVHESVIIVYGDGRHDVFTETYHDVSIPAGVLIIAPDEDTGMPLNCTCLGKILLAELSDEELTEYFKNKPIERHTPNSIVDLETMRNELKKVRQEGMAYDFEEFQVGMNAVGTGIRNEESKIIGGISIVGPNVRVDKSKISEVVAEVRSCGLEISREIGYKAFNLK